MANWQASLLMQTLSTGSVLVLQRDKTDKNEVPTLHASSPFPIDRGRIAMATYCVLGNFTEQGVRNAKDSPKRAEAFKDMPPRNWCRRRRALLCCLK